MCQLCEPTEICLEKIVELTFYLWWVFSHLEPLCAVRWQLLPGWMAGLAGWMAQRRIKKLLTNPPNML